MARSDVFVSVLAVLHDHGALLPAFVGDVSRVLEANYTNFEILLVDNGSQDDTTTILQPLLREYRCVRFLKLSRRMEHETAVMAGLDAVIGDFVVTLHPDFDPPDDIVSMVEQCRAGHDVVVGVDTKRRPRLVYGLLRRVFFVLTRWLVGVRLIEGTTGYRVLSRHAVNALTRVRQRRRYFDLIASDIGFVTAIHRYQGIARSGARLPVHLGTALRLGLSVIVHNSMAPLRLVSVLGVLGSFLSLLYSLYVVVVNVIKQDVMPGWTTLSLSMSALFCLVFVMLTLLGEYLGRVLEESSDRPLYYVREEQASAVMLSDLTRRNVMDRSEAEPPTVTPTEER